MTAKQLAQRLGVEINRLDFAVVRFCTGCRNLGGSEGHTCEPCAPQVIVHIKEEAGDSCCK
jgi:hypothetical protein